MNAEALSSLNLEALCDRLRALTGEERNLQADFLLHLDELDRRRGFAELGYPSLWEYCLRGLHLREGAAGRRIGAMRVLRRFPALEGAVRDGRLCLSTLSMLGPALTAENVVDLAARAAFKTKAEVDAIVASVKPRVTPANGVRRVPRPGQSATPTATPSPTSNPTQAPSTASASPSLSRDPGLGRDECGQGLTATSPPLAVPHANRPAAVELRAVSDERWSLRVTLDAEAKRDLETLTALLGHKIPRADVSAVLKEALRCAVERHSVRRGAKAPARTRRARSEGTPDGEGTGGAISAAVRREVWVRDDGRCTFTALDGTRCGSRWQLELDHVTPRALGGPSTADNLRLRCRVHNILRRAGLWPRAHGAIPERRPGRVAGHRFERAAPMKRKPGLRNGVPQEFHGSARC